MTAATLMGSPVYQAGLDRNDRIVSIDGRAMAGAGDWSAVLASHKPGDAVPLVYESRGSTVNTTISFAQNPRIEIVTLEEAGETVSDQVRAFRMSWLGK
ncbi:MAG: PDZ domain-containing protein [Gemmatimonadaceae bacterium]|nr:PDZ domain-containing protein [Gemmatimonadaceae bacterium]